ncbi:helix-turn-helix domain-containing protein [Neptunicella marina]|uniref:Helix-turn-helix domain-containing protein n=1 Tax=Neptunicella marina TaxID=2125989 RepID=A0A8J6ITJ1_9ALTE|nr:helix-turn-helix transcriptional regulator [Neptunicella marina]MBC3767140.1 helix-turn-helix domain-containing protein [Neptunicella marina]
MEKELMVNSDVVKTLRKRSGWSQEQLAKACGLGLRTIQRVESEGRASLETKVCLAAALQVPLEKLDTPSSVLSSRSLKYSKPFLALLVLSVFLSVVGLFINGPKPIFFVSNIVTVFGVIYCAFNWYFSTNSPRPLTVKSQVGAGFIYVGIFSLFAIFGNLGTAIIIPMLVSLVLFSFIFNLVSKKVN